MSLPHLHNYLLTFPDGTRWRTGYVYGAEGRVEYELAQRERDELVVEVEHRIVEEAEQ